jgi:hypothetical protein
MDDKGYALDRRDAERLERDVRLREAERNAHAGLAMTAEAPRNYAADLAGSATNSAYRPGEVTLENVDAVMAYQPWDEYQRQMGDQVREALTLAVKTILRTCPAGPYRSVAIRNILDARMNANASISFRGCF